MALRKPLTWLFAALLIYFLYFFHLTATGMLGPDEPRYAAIGREMARSGDWITPRLWGEPWFEKPALIYWMTSVAFRLGLGDDMAPRLPVAIVSVAFLALFFYLLRRQFGERPALFATVILGASAGWIGLSHAGVPDIPLASSFTLAVLLARPWTQTGDRTLLPDASACLGVAVLAKGGVGLVLILPVLWTGRKYWRDLFRPTVWLPFAAVALPWYLLCYLRNGRVFLDMFFWRHQVERMVSSSLQHGQPFWFYLPVLLAGLFPWTPLIALIFRSNVRKAAADLLLVVGFGLVFFSASLNKLPEYLLPLLPSLAAVAGLALADLEGVKLFGQAETPAPPKPKTNSVDVGIDVQPDDLGAQSDTMPRQGSLAAAQPADGGAGKVGQAFSPARYALAACAALACVAPMLGGILPEALASGIGRAHPPPIVWLWIIPLAFLVLPLRPVVAAGAIAAVVTAATVFLKVASLPLVDAAVSARPIWRQIAARRDQVCVEAMHRRYQYGLNYYSVTPLPDCEAEEKPVHIVQSGGDPPRLK